MEQTPKTSFIPKQASGLAPKRQRRTFNVLTFVATVIFLTALALAVGVFFYYQYSHDRLEARKSKLAELKSSFSEGDITSLRDLERQLNAAKSLLDQHISLGKVFDALETRTQQHAQFSSFSFTRLPSGGAQVELGGKALSFNTVALQEQEFANEPVFRQGTVLFSSLAIAKDESGQSTASFRVSADLDTSAVAYTATTTDSSPVTTDTLFVASSSVQVASSTASTTP